MNGYCYGEHLYNTRLTEEQQELKNILETLAGDYYWLSHSIEGKIKKINCRTNTKNTIKSILELNDDLSKKNPYFNNLIALNKTTNQVG